MGIFYMHPAHSTAKASNKHSTNWRTTNQCGHDCLHRWLAKGPRCQISLLDKTLKISDKKYSASCFIFWFSAPSPHNSTKGCCPLFLQWCWYCVADETSVYVEDQWNKVLHYMLLEEQVTCYSTEYIHTYIHTKCTYMHTLHIVRMHSHKYIHMYIRYSRKIWWEIKFVGLAVEVETVKLKSVNSFLPTVTCYCNYYVDDHNNRKRSGQDDELCSPFYISSCKPATDFW